MINMYCCECGKSLVSVEVHAGYCAQCSAQMENDLRILQENENENFEYIAELTH